MSTITPSETLASAPAKLILCGEHAVVYGRPAIALPLAGIRARVKIEPGRPGSGVVIFARDLRRRWWLAADPANPLSALITSVLAALGLGGARLPDLRLAIRSNIPIASGMGSGAAVATALVRALAAHFGRALPPAEVSALVFASEQRFHGTPSGIDNTVIAFEQPIWFVRPSVASRESGIGMGSPPPPIIEPITIAAPFTLLIGDTGVRSPTRAPVGQVRARWQADPAQYEALFDEIAALARDIRASLARGHLAELGPLLSQNHALLQRIGVSSPELDALVAAALGAGALGAKLSGAGWGGVMLALATNETKAEVGQALCAAGARRVIETTVEPHASPHTPAADPL